MKVIRPALLAMSIFASQQMFVATVDRFSPRPASVVCRLVDTDPSRADASGQAIPCPRSGEHVSCDFPDFEPIDLAAQACKPGVVPVIHARQTQLINATAGITVEWLIARSGRLDVVASRTLTGSTILVGAAGDRAVRFRRQDAGPLTVPETELGSGLYRLPMPQGGGELLVTSTRSVVKPAAYRIASAIRSTDVAATPRLFESLQGLPAGRYLISPIYAGGLVGKAVAADVAIGESTFADLPPDAAGAVHVEVGSEACARAIAVRLEKVTAGTNGTTLRRQVSEWSSAGCTQDVGGLPPGKYEASLVDGTGTFASARAEVRNQQTTDVQIAVDEVAVSGVITVMGKPAGGVALQFQENSTTYPPPAAVQSTPSDSAGNFRAELVHAGTYSVTAIRSGVPLLGLAKAVHADPGSNHLDWDLPGGAVEITLDNWDRSSPVDLDLSRTRGVGEKSAFEGETRLQESTRLPLDIQGLPTGSYSIRARQRTGSGHRRVSGKEDFEISDRRAKAVVHLSLSDYDALVLLRDPTGLPVSGAQVTDGYRSVTEDSPGEYRLGGDAGPGTFLEIRAPNLAQVCRKAPDSGTLQVDLEPALSLQILYIGRSDLTGPVGQLQWQGSECPLKIVYMTTGTAVANRDTSTTSFLAVGLPNRRSFEFSIPGVLAPVVVSVAGGVLRLPLPK